MRLPELKSVARERGLRGCSHMRKTDLVALLQNNITPRGPHQVSFSLTISSLKEAVDEISKHELTNPMYLTLKLYGRGGCRIHSISGGDKEIVVNKRYVVKPWESTGVVRM